MRAFTTRIAFVHRVAKTAARANASVGDKDAQSMMSSAKTM